MKNSRKLAWVVLVSVVVLVLTLSIGALSRWDSLVYGEWKAGPSGSGFGGAGYISPPSPGQSKSRKKKYSWLPGNAFQTVRIPPEEWKALMRSQDPGFMKWFDARWHEHGRRVQDAGTP